MFSALIHDADHAGVSNAQLVKEKAAVSIRYKQKSVLEQNSVDLAWNMLMETEYNKLRNVIYETDAELKRFRQYVSLVYQAHFSNCLHFFDQIDGKRRNGYRYC